MEIVLLWLDDLDDLVFCAILKWEQARRLCLQIGLLASITLAVSELFATASMWTVKLAVLAIACVTLWLLAACVAAARRLDPRLV